MIGDSRLVIQDLTTNSLPSQMQIQQLIKKIQNLAKSFRRIEYFHVLRSLNDKADQAVNVASTLSKGTLVLNGISSSYQIP